MAWSLIKLTPKYIGRLKSSNNKRKKNNEMVESKLKEGQKKKVYYDEICCNKCGLKFDVNEEVWRRIMRYKYSKVVLYCKECYEGLWN